MRILSLMVALLSVPARASTLANPVDVQNTDLASAIACKLVAADGSSFYNASGGSGGTTGGLTNTELRASPVPVSGSMSVSNFPASQAVTGTFWPTTAAAPNSCRLSDGSAFIDPRSIRALTSSDQVTVANSSLAVTGPLTDTQLRASAVPISAASLPLPTGASTAANQTTLNASAASIDSKLSGNLKVQGPTAEGATITQAPIVIAGKSSTITTGVYTVQSPSLTSPDNDGNGNAIQAFDVWDWSRGSTKVSSSTFTNGSASLFLKFGGRTQSFWLDVGGTFTGSITVTEQIASNVATVQLRAINSGTALSAVTSPGLYVVEGINQDGITIVNGVTSGSADVYALSEPGGLTGIRTWQAGNWDVRNITGTLSLPTGASTSANQTTELASLASIDGKLKALGQNTMANSMPVTIASNQSSLPVTVGNFPATQAVSIASMPSTPVTGPLTDTQLRASAVPVSGAFFQATQPVSIASMPSTPVTNANLDVALSTRLKPADTLAGVTAVGSITNALPAGTNLLGKVGIDQTTPGTTNKVSIGTDGTVAINAALPTGGNTIGAVTNANLDVALSTRLKPADTLAGVTTVGAVTAITNALPTGANTIGAVSIGTSTGKAIVGKTGTLVSTATTADQVAVTYTVTAGKTFYLESWDVDARLTAVSVTGSILGACSLETPSGTKVATHTFVNGTDEHVERFGPVVYSEPLPVAAAAVIRIVCTPAAATSMTWIGNIMGYEK